jgi:hypothetical protein
MDYCLDGFSDYISDYFSDVPLTGEDLGVDPSLVFGEREGDLAPNIMFQISLLIYS